MNLLVDTHLLLWTVGYPEKLSDAARTLLVNPDNHLMVSAASLWEITIKRSLGRADFQVEPSPLRRGLLEHGWTELMIRSEQAIATATGYLPALHKDPFDRMLLAQVGVEGVTLLTVDNLIAQYTGPLRKV